MSIQEKFIYACYDGKLKKVQKMLNNKFLTFFRLISLNRSRKFCYSPLTAAVTNGHLSIINLLIKYGADVNKEIGNGSTPLDYASINRNIEIVKTLLSSGADINKGNPLYYASRNGNFEVAKLLIDSGADMNNELYSTPLDIASDIGHHDIVKLLINSGADVNKKSKKNTPLYTASSRGRVKIVELLIISGAIVNEESHDNETPLFTATKHGHFDTVKLLVNSGADVNIKDRRGTSPLMVACKINSVHIFTFLLSNGANIDDQNSSGTSVFWHAIMGIKYYDDFEKIANFFYIAFQKGAKIEEYAARYHRLTIENYWDKIESIHYKQQNISYATCKGSIGHDELNVKTLSKTEWEERMRNFHHHMDNSRKEEYAILH